MKHTRGVTLIESLAIAAIGVIVMGAVVQVFISFGTVTKFTTNMPPVQSDATEVVNRIAASLRSAPLCDTDSGCTGTQDAAITTASATGITIYKTAAGATTQYSVDGAGNFKSTESTGLKVLATPAVTVSMQYLLSSSGVYSMTSDPSTATWVTSVTSSTDRKNLIAARITATVVRNGLTGSYSTVVRLRNSPKKTSSNS